LDPALALRGFILGFTIAAAVGPISLLVIRRTLAEGRLYGLVSGLGVATADATYGAIAAFGLAAVTDALVSARAVLGLVGGAFLLWMAWQTARSTPTEVRVSARPLCRGASDVLRSRSLGPLADVKLHTIPFAQILKPLTVDGTPMEEVFLSCLVLDEPEAFIHSQRTNLACHHRPPSTVVTTTRCPDHMPWWHSC